MIAMKFSPSNLRFVREALLLSVVALVACVAQAPTPYQPLQADGGYTEQRIEANRYRVSFVGNQTTTREQVENALLFRIAELTLSQGYDYFVLSGSDTEASTTYLQTMVGYDTFDPLSPRFWPRTNFASGTASPMTSYKAQAYVLMQSGQRPDNDPSAYDAREVSRTLGPALSRGGSPGR